ncbi:MAG: helix-turn-helix transcriptional regulator [Clostridia bacterium]
MKFKELRLSKGFKTAKELAIKAEINQWNIAKWETGKARPKFDTIKKLAKILNVSVEDILNCF